MIIKILITTITLIRKKIKNKNKNIRNKTHAKPSVYTPIVITALKLHWSAPWREHGEGKIWQSSVVPTCMCVQDVVNWSVGKNFLYGLVYGWCVGGVWMVYGWCMDGV